MGADNSPEGLAFVPAAKSPTGSALLLAACEVGGTVAVYDLTPASGGSDDGDDDSHGSSSGGGTVTYPVKVETAANGTITVSPRNAEKGGTVTITVKPDSGYALEELSVLDRNGDAVKITDKGSGRYTFTMPSGKVTVSAAFAKHSTGTGFTDVPEDYWAREAITWAQESGYMTGKTASAFAPNGVVTRQQLWMILARLSGERPAGMAEARTWAMTNGVSDGSAPVNAVSRQQMVTILYRYADLKGYEVSAKAGLTAFPDSGAVAAYAEDAMAWSVANGIVGGTAQGTLDPADTATRAQFAAILMRFADTFVE